MPAHATDEQATGHPLPGPRRCLGVWLAATLVGVALIALAGPETLRAGAAAYDGGWRTADLEQLVTWLCAGAVTTGTAWLWLMTGVVTLAAARGRACSVRGCPEVLRRSVLSACGVAVGVGVVGGLALPAGAEDVPVPVLSGSTSGADDAPRAGTGLDLDGLPTPDRPRSDGAERDRPQADRPHHDRPQADRPGAPAPRSPEQQPTPQRAERLVVRPGDTLWTLAEGRLDERGASTAAAAVDREWRRLHTLNADVVGADPDLIHPGQRLRTHRGDEEQR